ncbi:MAG: transposase domain-containing protein [Ktedonobacteraceae bacterium]
MPFSITHLPTNDKLCRTLTWPILEQFYPRQRIELLVETYCEKTTRVRKLTLVLVVWVLICWHLYLRHSLGGVFLKLSSAERWLGEDEPESPPTRAAWTRARANNSACGSCAPSLKSRVCHWPPQTRRVPLPLVCD